jgi:hypothetical protein
VGFSHNGGESVGGVDRDDGALEVTASNKRVVNDSVGVMPSFN